MYTDRMMTEYQYEADLRDAEVYAQRRRELEARRRPARRRADRVTGRLVRLLRPGI